MIKEFKVIQEVEMVEMDYQEQEVIKERKEIDEIQVQKVIKGIRVIEIEQKPSLRRSQGSFATSNLLRV